SIFGIPLTTDHTFPVTFTAGAPVSPGPGVNLVGNPYEVDLDWDHAGWTRTNVSNTLYIWDPAANSGMGEFLDWTPGLGGTLASGVIPVGQGFHVEATGPDPVLVAPAAARLATRSKVIGLTGSTAPTMSKAAGVPHVRFTLSDGEHESQVRVALREGAALGLDPFDGRRLAGARGADALRLYARIPTSHAGAGSALAVAGLPRDADGPLAVGLHAEALQAGAPGRSDATLAWESMDVPSGWSATLLDRRTGQTYDLTASGEMALTLAPEDALTASDADLVASKADRLVPPTPRALHALGSARFVVTLTPEARADGGAGLRAEVGPLAPNPSRGDAHLSIALPASGEVKVDVFDALGRRVATVHDGPLAAGTSRVRINVSSLAPGAYVVRTSGAVVGSRRFTVVR
ncbi:MAG: T9SS type A sorting domain-containing protein, partial [Bacteroidota bacterium]